MSLLTNLVKESFQDIDLKQSFNLELEEKEPVHMNIRIPFCENNCGFCLYGGSNTSEEEVNKFIQGIKREIDHYLQSDLEISSVYFNAGTPTMIIDKLKELLNYLRDTHDFDGECLTEAHPCDLDSESLDKLTDIGIDKIKIGVQSFNNDILNDLGRNYSREEAIDAVKGSLKKDFDHISVDLMYLLENQTIKNLEDDLEVCHDLNIPCVTFFPLIGLSYSAMGDDEIRSSKRMKKQYNKIIDFFEDKEHEMRTIWSFSKNPEEYKGEYMHKDNFIGLGPSNWSYLDGNLYLNTNHMEDYLEGTKKGLPISVGTKFEGWKEEKLWLLRKLYLTKVDVEDFEKKFGKKLEEDLDKVLNSLMELDLIERENNYLKLTRKGLITGNELTHDIVSLLLEKFQDNRLISANPQKIASH